MTCKKAVWVRILCFVLLLRISFLMSCSLVELSPPPSSFFGPLFGANLMRLSNLIPMRNHISRHLLIEPENVLWLMSF